MNDDLDGAGKTSTLEMIGGIRTPDSGTYDFGNEMHIARNASPSPLNARVFFWRGISTTSAL
jgi:ABC-type sulfate/molybdate transport systems ATPase subunit